MTRQIDRFITTLGLLLLGATPAWAGRGDIDPNYLLDGSELLYSEPGGVAIVNSVLLALPGDRLAIAKLGEQGLLIRMVDATGQVIPDFGEGGSVLINSPALGTFEPAAAALAPNGDMIFLGVLGDAADTLPRSILRLDSAGQPVASFGTRGDGFVEPALARARALAFAVDPDGKIVLGEGSWDGDVNCDSIARVQRLGADGQPDAGFGGDGIAEIPDLDICNGASVFGVRADSSVIVGDGSTIVAVDATGEIDPTFGVDGRLAIDGLASAGRLLLPDGGLLFFGSSTDTGSSDTVMQKLDRNGQPDLAFGSGTGTVTVDLGAELLGVTSAREELWQLVFDPDGEHFFAGLGVSPTDGSFACSGIARLAIDGTPDVTFGRDGMTCLNFNFGLVAVQSAGAPLFVGGPRLDTMFRLLPDNSPSPGLLAVVSAPRTVGESAGSATVTVGRFAGRDGAVSADFTTTGRRVPYQCGYSRCVTNGADAGSDYTTNSGRLDWADGDDGERTVTVSIRDDAIHENLETFGVDFSEPGGGALLFAENLTVYISDNDAARPPPPPDDDPATSGGGGSVSWATALALLGLLLLLRRRDLWRRAARTRLHEE
jgi:uncharacterized delta-60 repeat protein